MPKQSNCPAEIIRMTDEKGDDALPIGVAPQRLAFGPLAPMVAQQLLFIAVRWPIVGVRFGDGKPQGPLIVAQAPGPGNKLARLAQRAESLVGEVIRQAINSNGGR